MKNNKPCLEGFFLLYDYPPPPAGKVRKVAITMALTCEQIYSCKNRVLRLFTQGSCALSWLSTVVRSIHIWTVSRPGFPPSPRSSTPPPLQVLLFIKHAQKNSLCQHQDEALAKLLLTLFISRTPLTVYFQSSGHPSKSICLSSVFIK